MATTDPNRQNVRLPPVDFIVISSDEEPEYDEYDDSQSDSSLPLIDALLRKQNGTESGACASGLGRPDLPSATVAGFSRKSALSGDLRQVNGLKRPPSPLSVTSPPSAAAHPKETFTVFAKVAEAASSGGCQSTPAVRNPFPATCFAPPLGLLSLDIAARDFAYEKSERPANHQSPLAAPSLARTATIPPEGTLRSDTCEGVGSRQPTGSQQSKAGKKRKTSDDEEGEEGHCDDEPPRQRRCRQRRTPTQANSGGHTVEEEREWGVKEILGHRKRKGRYEALVRWHSSWEPREALRETKALEEYEGARQDWWHFSTLVGRP